LPADHPLERGDLGFVLLQQVGGLDVLIQRAGLVLADPDADQLTRDVVALRQPMQRLAADKLLARLEQLIGRCGWK
jgi:hypothetical protein